RVPADMPYREEFGRLGSPMDYEYAWLGLTFAGLFLGVTGAVWAWTHRRRALVVLTLAALLLCLGPNLPPDGHFLLVGGLPFVGDLAQPMKYWNVFLVLSLCLLGGAAAQGAQERAGWLGPALCALFLLAPAWQNHSLLAEAFSHQREPVVPSASFSQRSLIDDASRAGDEPRRIAQTVETKRLREYRRAPGASEWDLAPAGIGLVSWYGTLELPERAVPDVWVTPEGETRANPRSQGPVWLEGEGEIVEWEVGPNELWAQVRAPIGGIVMFSQEALGKDDWVVEGGELFPVHGLLGARVKSGKDGTVRLTYRPPLLLTGLKVSAGSFVLWCLLMVAWRRES
ncbi:MAG: hypothetical protein KDA24_24625, partial [Deltaproteobacteria bacterium]|nr:hypothetical protein [Deltaproteobacteria bacterium]